MADTQHVGGNLFAVLHVQLKELVKVVKGRLIACGSIVGTEDGYHFEALTDDIVARVKVSCGVTGDHCVDDGVELATLGSVGCGGLGHFYGVAEGAVTIK